MIVTRHGVRSISKTPSTYSWPKWDPVKFNDLTGHGYRLMKLMGAFYRNDALEQGIPVDCEHDGAFIYADKVQRTLETAYALVEGLCGSPDKLPVFRVMDTTRQDPIFNATEFSKEKIDSLLSERAVKAAAGDLGKIVPAHEDDFDKLQRLLGTRCCPGPCKPIASGASTIKCEEANAVGMADADNADGECKAGGHILAALKGPVATASTYAEDLFLEYAEGRPIDKMTSLDPATFEADLDAGMRLHVLAYRINARNDTLNPDVGASNAYNPFVRGATLLVHIVAMLDLRAGRHVLENVGVTTPKELNDKTLAIFSGHDTQLGALGGMLSAHWTPGGGIVPDDMPPGSALIFDLVPLQGGEFGVRLRFAAMGIDQFRTNEPIDEKSIAATDVAFAGCAPVGCTASLKWFESLALKLEARKDWVDDKWPPYDSALADPDNPDWTEPQCRR